MGTHNDNSVLCACNQCDLYANVVNHKICDCRQIGSCKQYYDHITESYVEQNNVELSEITCKGNSVTRGISFDNKNVKNMYGDSKYSHATVIDHYRHIQSTDVSFSRDSHRNASTKVPVNNTKPGVGFVCNTNNINTYCDIMKYDCVAYVNTLDVSAAHGGLEHHNIGHNCVWGCMMLIFCNAMGYNSPLLTTWCIAPH